MKSLRNYDVADSRSAEEFLSRAQNLFEESVSLLPDAWLDMEEDGLWERLASIRFHVMNYVSTAYAFRESEKFVSACQNFLDHSIARSTKIDLSPRRLVSDISFAISLGWREDVQLIASKILEQSETTGNEPPESLCAVILAALVDLNFSLATNVVEKLLAACEEKRYSKKECAWFNAWANTADMMARREPSDLIESLSKLDETARQRVKKEMTRWEKGGHSDLMAVDYWDFKTTALAAVAMDYGLVDTDTGVAWSPFFDSVWTRECGHGRDR